MSFRVVALEQKKTGASLAGGRRQMFVSVAPNAQLERLGEIERVIYCLSEES